MADIPKSLRPTAAVEKIQLERRIILGQLAGWRLYASVPIFGFELQTWRVRWRTIKADFNPVSENNALN